MIRDKNQHFIICVYRTLPKDTAVESLVELADQKPFAYVNEYMSFESDPASNDISIQKKNYTTLVDEEDTMNETNHETAVKDMHEADSSQADPKGKHVNTNIGHRINRSHKKGKVDISIETINGELGSTTSTLGTRLESSTSTFMTQLGLDNDMDITEKPVHSATGSLQHVYPDQKERHIVMNKDGDVTDNQAPVLQDQNKSPSMATRKSSGVQPEGTGQPEWTPPMGKSKVVSFAEGQPQIIPDQIGSKRSDITNKLDSFSGDPNQEEKMEPLVMKKVKAFEAVMDNQKDLRQAPVYVGHDVSPSDIIGGEDITTFRTEVTTKQPMVNGYIKSSMPPGDADSNDADSLAPSNVMFLADVHHEANTDKHKRASLSTHLSVNDNPISNSYHVTNIHGNQSAGHLKNTSETGMQTTKAPSVDNTPKPDKTNMLTASQNSIGSVGFEIVMEFPEGCLKRFKTDHGEKFVMESKTYDDGDSIPEDDIYASIAKNMKKKITSEFKI